MNNGEAAVEFRNKLTRWWKFYGRKFPWRETEDPYKILVAEVLLHRTRAEQVVPVYSAFISEFPDIFSLAKSSKDKVMKLVYPLGLRWRAELLYEMAIEIMGRGGRIKADKNWLCSLPGVNDYIASAVMSFAFNKPEPILDTNTVRIIGRLTGMRVTDSSRRSRKFREIYLYLMDRKNPRIFNMAMIDLGALVCRARTPLCDRCPLKKWCAYTCTSCL